MIKNIDTEIEKLLQIKEEINHIIELKKTVPNLMVLSQARYNFFKENNLLQSEVFYYIASLDVRPYIEGFQG